MRVKQTARKSTATAIDGPSSVAPSSSLSSLRSSQPISSKTIPIRKNTKVQNDPALTRMKNLLETKRKSATPNHNSLSSIGSAEGCGRGKTLPYYTEESPGVKVRPRMRSGQRVLREIKTLQKGWDVLIARAPFHRVVREISQGVMSERGEPETAIRFQTAALEALQEATEHYIIRMFEDSYLCCLHAKRVTLFVQDMQLCRRLQGQL